MFYSGDEFADDDCTSGPVYDAWWWLPPEAPASDDMPVDLDDERRT